MRMTKDDSVIRAELLELAAKYREYPYDTTVRVSDKDAAAALVCIIFASPAADSSCPDFRSMTAREFSLFIDKIEWPFGRDDFRYMSPVKIQKYSSMHLVMPDGRTLCGYNPKADVIISKRRPDLKLCSGCRRESQSTATPSNISSGYDADSQWSAKPPTVGQLDFVRFLVSEGIDPPPFAPEDATRGALATWIDRARNQPRPIKPDLKVVETAGGNVVPFRR